MNPAHAGAQARRAAHLRLSRRAARAEAEDRLAEVRIGNAGQALRRYEFSGGMQRLMIAMGLMARPRLIADEPTTAPT